MSKFASMQPIKGSPFTIYARHDRHYQDTDRWSPDTIYPVGQTVQHLVTATSVCVSTWGNMHAEIGLGWYRSGNDSFVTVIPVQEAKQLRCITTLHHEILFVTDRGIMKW